MKSKTLLNFSFAVLFCLVSGMTAAAQTINGTISGNVVDQQKAAVPGATVTVTNTQTGLERSATTNESGSFRIAGLAVGTYNVRVSGTGFAPLTRENVQVSTSVETSLDFDLSPGSVEATVDVTSSGELLDTTQSQVVKTVSQQQILELPGRNSLNGLALLNPGVLPTQNGRPGSGFAVNGNRSRSNNFTIDGANNNDQSLSIPRQQLPPEAIGEFQIITNTFAAEYGRNAGSYVNVITASGTNRFAGNVFYNWQGNGLDALTTGQERTFRANLAAGVNEQVALRRSRSVLVDQVYGGTFGGPIVKNHTFFFTSLDFNPIRTTIGALSRPALDANSRALLQANVGNFASPAAAQFLLSNFPVANDPTLASTSLAGSTVNVTTTGGTVLPLVFRTYNRTLSEGLPYGTDFGRWLMKVDTKINNRDRLSFRYLVDKFTDNGSPASLPGLEIGQLTKNQSFTINDAYLLTSRLLNEFRFTYSTRDLSFPENLDAFANGAQLAIGGSFGAFSGGNANFPQGRNDKVYEFTDNVSFTTGNHSLKFGYNLLRYDLNSFFAPNSKGLIQYGTLQNFLSDSILQLQNATGDFVTPAVTYEHGIFAQDDWRVNNDLTLNLGLRYEYVTTPLGYFSNAKSDLNNFGPRVGFAYNPKNFMGGRMVLRAGLSRAYDQVFQNILLNVSRNYPRVVNNVVTNCVGCAPFLGFGNIPVTATSTQITGSVRSFFSRGPQSVPAAEIPLLPYRYFALNERIKQPQSTQWTLSFQYLFGNDYVFKAEYIGTKGENLVRELEENYGFAPPIGNNQRLDPTRGSILVGQGIANSIYHAGQFTFERRPADLNVLGLNLGLLTFNANYTYSSFISESDDVLGGQLNRTIPSDPRNPSFDRARSGFDQPHRFVFNAVWESPDVFRGGGFGNAFLNRALSRWQISTVTTIASGIPFTIFSGLNGAGILPGQIATINLSQRVGYNPNGVPGTFTGTSASGVPTNPNAQYIIYATNSGIFGSLGANTERTPHTINSNFAFVKNIRTFGERQRLQLRAEVFNAFNRRNFTVIPTNTIVPTTNPTTFLNYGLTNVGGRGFTFGARYFF